jgi:transposase
MAARIVAPHTKLATTLATDFGVADANEDDLSTAMDWLLARQDTMQKLAARHLSAGGLVLYDLSSSYFEGTSCPLARLGHNRDGKKGLLQINYGLLTDARGCPVAVSVHEGNVADSATFLPEVQRLREHFGIEQLVMVGDRGMVGNASIAQLREVAGIDWITALKSASIRTLVEQGQLQLGLFDERNLQQINDSVDAGRLKGSNAIALRVGKVIKQYKVARHFELDMGENRFTFVRKHEAIAAEAALDGIYIIRTPVDAARMEAAGCVRNYKSLASVERALRSLKTMDLKVRPIHHRTADRVRAHILLCMLAYYLNATRRGDAIKRWMADLTKGKTVTSDASGHRRWAFAN